MIQNARDAMSDELKEEYKRLGESMFEHDFVNTCEVTEVGTGDLAPVEPSLILHECLKSGLHPDDLDDNDVSVLTSVYGKEWYVKYGYIKLDDGTYEML